MSSHPQSTDFSGILCRLCPPLPAVSTGSPMVDLVAAKLIDFSGSNNGVIVDDGDLIQGHHPGVGRVQSGSSRSLRNGGGGSCSGAQSPALSNTSSRFGGSDDGSNAMAAAHQQAAPAGLGMVVGGFNLGLGSPRLAGMPNGLNSRS
ncbi:hypothetical protein EDB86DRAFT_3078381 [Lactarius hatsudake]|nr:hypothetical protein EDB86DRAFT_3078381 [Lactarius hatsudake]